MLLSPTFQLMTAIIKDNPVQQKISTKNTSIYSHWNAQFTHISDIAASFMYTIYMFINPLAYTNACQMV